MYRFATEAERVAWELTPQPLWLDAPGGPLHCWYHRPREVCRGRGVLLCDPLGSDRMNLHLSYRHLALQLAWSGYPVLRLDYPGTGDSAGSPRDPDRVAAWFEALHRGADTLKQRSRVAELAVMGALFGATLAAGLAAQRRDVSGLVAWGAYASGAEFLRSARAIERMSGSSSHKRKAPDWREGDLESLGYLFTAETVEAMMQLDISSLDLTHLRDACLIPWDEQNGLKGLSAALQRAGCAVTHHAAPLSSGAASLQRQRIPEAVIQAALDWLQTTEGPSASVSAAGVAAASAQTSRDADPLPVQSSFRGVRERCIRMGPEGAVFGILAEPDGSHGGAPPELAVVLVNGGNNHRAGINRNYTEWSRRWAQLGVPVLRLDIRGLGDSPPARAAELNVLYRRDTAADLVSAMDWLQANCQISRFVLGGLCAGAFQSLHAARTDRRVIGLWLLELLRFYHDDRAIRIRLARLARRALTRLTGTRYRWPSLLHAPLARWLRDLCTGRAVKVLALYRVDEAMLTSFRQEVASVQRALTRSGNYELHLVENTNHIFSPIWSQAELTGILDGHLARIRGAGQRKSQAA